MVVVMTRKDEGNMTFHDFLGVSSEDSAAFVARDSASLGDARAAEASASVSVGAPSLTRGPVSSSDIASGDHLHGVRLHGSKSDISLPQISNMFSGRKRGNTDSGLMGSLRDRMRLIRVDSVESSRLVKMFQNEIGGEQGRSDHDHCASLSMQPPKQTSAPVILQQPSRPDSVVSDQEHSLPLPVSAGPLVHYPSHFDKSPPYMDKVYLKKYGDTALAGASTCISPAADEGSRTGKKDSSIPHAMGVSSIVPQRNATELLPSSSRANVSHKNSGAESGNTLRRCFLTSSSRQMTIFYAGQAHVFDDVHPNKAQVNPHDFLFFPGNALDDVHGITYSCLKDLYTHNELSEDDVMDVSMHLMKFLAKAGEIMTLAGSGGGSWSMTYSPASTVRQPSPEAYAPCSENEAGINNIEFWQEKRSGLVSFQSSYQGVSQSKHPSIPSDHLNL